MSDLDRRAFLAASLRYAAGFAGLGLLAGAARAGEAPPPPAAPAWRADPSGLLDLAPGYACTVLQRSGQAMSDGTVVPMALDGMGCFATADGWTLVRNHELGTDPGEQRASPFANGLGQVPAARVHRADAWGGTTTVVLDPRTLAVASSFVSLAGTNRNCAGGVTPWGSWLTCEEVDIRTAPAEHGWVFEVPAAARAAVEPVPLRALGRCRHEAAVIDPRTGIVYLTEDERVGFLYRCIPTERGALAKGGRLQALVLDGLKDTANHHEPAMPIGQAIAGRWVDIPDPATCSVQARRAGAVRISRGEGLWWDGDGCWVTATNGGPNQVGQLFLLRPGAETTTLTLVHELRRDGQLLSPDNLCLAPGGSLVVCEDHPNARCHLVLVGKDGTMRRFARSHGTEFAGACFSPDGRVLFANLYDSATVAITGPWAG